MTSTASTPLWSSSRLGAAWGQLLGLLALALLAGACSKGPTEIGVGLPDVNANTGAYLVDTLTVRTSTVLRDSVVTSGSSYLLVGRTTDALFGKLTARSYFRVGGSFTPESNYEADSVALLLSADTYRYGDTTQTQALFNVYRMDTPLPLNKPLFASPNLTPLASYYDPSNPDKQLNVNQMARFARARPTAYTVRIPLKNSFAQELMTAGKAGLLSTQDQLQAYLAGLAVTPADRDNAALVRLSATSTDLGLLLYYHNPNDPSTPLRSVFSVGQGGAHCFQVSADPTGTPAQAVASLKSLQGLPASATGFNTYIEGAIGYQTRLEIPYLSDLKRLGQNITITSAQITAEVPTATLTQYVPTPPSIIVRTSNLQNQPVATYLSSVDYKTSISPTTALDQGSYTWAVTSYVQAVLANTVANNGFLLSTTTPELPTRLVLGSSRNQLNPLRLRVYVISTN